MTSKLTREKAQWLHDACEEAAAAGIKLTMNPNELLMFTSYALVAMDSEPVKRVNADQMHHVCLEANRHLDKYGAMAKEVNKLLGRIPAQPAPERDQVRQEHAEWSQATFGNVGPVGPLKHLSKEALEAAAEPGDLSEWADMQFLLWDAQRRAGITDDQITQAMIDKLAVNKQRSWPEPKDGEPRLHIKAQPAPELKPVGYLFVSDQGAVAYSPTNWGMPGFRLIGQIYGDMSVELPAAPQEVK
ncbi:Eaa1 [Klebsiella pneumoniae]|nr:Eaa1 [Klebsiella pneumoniae]